MEDDIVGVSRRQLPSMLKEITPPTDNFYKFVAISGLIGALFFGSLPFYFFESHQELSRKINLEQLHFRRYLGEISLARDQLTAAENGSIPLEAKQKEWISDRKRRYESDIVHIKMDLDDLGRQLQEVAGPLYFFDGPVRWIWLTVLALSLSITYLGFRCWYCRHQKFQDMILKAEALRGKS